MCIINGGVIPSHEGSEQYGDQIIFVDPWVENQSQIWGILCPQYYAVKTIAYIRFEEVDRDQGWVQ